jgi:hypothetical protein
MRAFFVSRMSQHGLGLKKEGKKQNIDPVFNSSAVLFNFFIIKNKIIRYNNNNNNNNDTKNHKLLRPFLEMQLRLLCNNIFIYTDRKLKYSLL